MHLYAVFREVIIGGRIAALFQVLIQNDAHHYAGGGGLRQELLAGWCR